MEKGKQSLKDKILDVLKDFKRHGIDRQMLESELDVAKNYIDQNLSRGGNEAFYRRLVKLRESKGINIAKSNIVENGNEKVANSPDKEISNDLILGLIKNAQTLADANKSGIDANLILAQSNERLIGMIEYKFLPNSYFVNKNRLITDEANLKMIDLMARTLVRHGAYPTFDEAIVYLDMLLTSEEEEELFLDKKKQGGTQNTHNA